MPPTPWRSRCIWLRARRWQRWFSRALPISGPGPADLASIDPGILTGSLERLAAAVTLTESVVIFLTEPHAQSRTLAHVATVRLAHPPRALDHPRAGCARLRGAGGDRQTQVGARRRRDADPHHLQRDGARGRVVRGLRIKLTPIDNRTNVPYNPLTHHGRSGEAWRSGRSRTCGCRISGQRSPGGPIPGCRRAPWCCWTNTAGF